MITTQQLIKKYGMPNAKGAGYTVQITLPYVMYYEGARVTKMTCHKDVAQQFLAIFNDILVHYGEAEINRLKINDFGGCFNYRPKRGTEERFKVLMKSGNITEAMELLSTHSWAVAIDLNPSRNLLKETAKTARFARQEYKAMIDIFYKHGFVSLGREKNYDYMHFEVAS